MGSERFGHVPRCQTGHLHLGNYATVEGAALAIARRLRDEPAMAAHLEARQKARVEARRRRVARTGSGKRRRRKLYDDDGDDDDDKEEEVPYDDDDDDQGDDDEEEEGEEDEGIPMLVAEAWSDEDDEVYGSLPFVEVRLLNP